MSGTEWTAERVLAELTPGMRMKILFDTAKAATDIAPNELEALFAEPSYEARMAAFCILDFQARKRLGDVELRDTYLRHHDRIDAWDMVDRAAPRVVGATLSGGPYDLLHELADIRGPVSATDGDDRPVVVREVRRRQGRGGRHQRSRNCCTLTRTPSSTSRSASTSHTPATGFRNG